MELKDFAVGQKWNTRGGQVAVITSIIGGDAESFPVRGEIEIEGRMDKNGWTVAGAFFLSKENRFDLISLVKDVQVGVGVLQDAPTLEDHHEQTPCVTQPGFFRDREFADHLIFQTAARCNPDSGHSGDEVMIFVEEIMKRRKALTF